MAKKRVTFIDKKTGKKISFAANIKEPLNKMPKNPRKGQEFVIINKSGKKRLMEATGKKGFGAWKFKKWPADDHRNR